jgi:hypothetical protein
MNGSLKRDYRQYDGHVQHSPDAPEICHALRFLRPCSCAESWDGDFTAVKTEASNALDNIYHAADLVVPGAGQFLHAGWLRPPSARGGSDRPGDQRIHWPERRSLRLVISHSPAIEVALRSIPRTLFDVLRVALVAKIRTEVRL